jgi:hypothetical protein
VEASRQESDDGRRRRRCNTGRGIPAGKQQTGVPSATSSTTSWLANLLNDTENEESKLLDRNDEHINASKKSLTKYLAALHLCEDSEELANSQLSKAASSLKAAAEAFATMQRERQSAGLANNARKQDTAEDASRVAQMHAQALDLGLSMADETMTQETLKIIHALCTETLCQTSGQIRTKGASVGGRRCCGADLVDGQLSSCLVAIEQVCASYDQKVTKCYPNILELAAKYHTHTHTHTHTDTHADTYTRTHHKDKHISIHVLGSSLVNVSHTHLTTCMLFANIQKKTARKITISSPHFVAYTHTHQTGRKKYKWLHLRKGSRRGDTTLACNKPRNSSLPTKV